MTLRKIHSILFVALIPAFCSASANNFPLRVSADRASLSVHEQQVWASAIHDSEFSDIPHTTARNDCANTQPPEALATPNPLLDQPEPDSRVTVSFIIGTDGRVHSPLILEGNGTNEEQYVLEAVRSWRYRPAMCNGVPTEAEAKIEFSSR